MSHLYLLSDNTLADKTVIFGATGSTAAQTVNPIDGIPSNPGLVVVDQMMGYIGGNSWNQLRTPNVFKNLPAVAVTAGSGQFVWTPAGGKRFRLMGFAVSLSVAGSVIFKDSGGFGEFIRTPLMAAGVGIVSPPMGNGLLAEFPNDSLVIDATASGSISGFLFGTEE